MLRDGVAQRHPAVVCISHARPRRPVTARAEAQVGIEQVTFGFILGVTRRVEGVRKFPNDRLDVHGLDPGLVFSDKFKKSVAQFRRGVVRGHIAPFIAPLRGRLNHPTLALAHGQAGTHLGPAIRPTRGLSSFTFTGLGPPGFTGVVREPRDAGLERRRHHHPFVRQIERFGERHRE